MKKFFALIAVFSLLLALVACQTPGGDPDKTCDEDPTQEKCETTDNDWVPNKSGFDGKGMTIKIKVLPKAEYDPFDPNYTGDNVVERQKWQEAVQAAYNIRIEYVDYTDSEPWGPDRVQKIIDGHINQNRIGDIYLIATEWLPTLAETQAVASLYHTGTKEGYFTDFGFEPAKILRDIATYKKNVYAYVDGTPHPDYFMYYNATLVNKAGLKEPAQMWLDHEWTWSNFKTYLDAAHANAAFANAKMLTGQATEYLLGFVAAQGGKFVEPTTNGLLWSNPAVLDIISQLKGMYDKGYIDKDTTDVSGSFKSGTGLFATGGLWFVGSEMRFPSSLPFDIGVVPYPAADEDALTLTNYKVPVYGSSAYAIANVENGENGLNSKILFNILDDLQRGLKLDENQMTPEQAYEMWLDTKFSNKLYVNTIMDVQDLKYQYFEKIFLISMSVGNGSHYGPNAMYPLLNGIITNPARDARAELEAVRTVYETKLQDFK